MARPAAARKVATPQTESASRSALPAIGAPLGGGQFAGILRGAKGAPDYALVVLIDDQKALSWKAATAWAEKLSASLPTRDEARLCYVNLRDDFEEAWYWTSTQVAGHDADAWMQSFDGGTQGYDRKSGDFRARAVRRLPLQ